MDETMRAQLEGLATGTHRNVYAVLDALSRTTTPLSSQEVADLTGLTYPVVRGALAGAALSGWVSVSRDGRDYRWALDEAAILQLAFRRLFVQRDRLREQIAAATREINVIDTLAAACGISKGAEK